MLIDSQMQMLVLVKLKMHCQAIQSSSASPQMKHTQQLLPAAYRSVHSFFCSKSTQLKLEDHHARMVVGPTQDCSGELCKIVLDSMQVCFKLVMSAIAGQPRRYILIFFAGVF